MLAKVFSGATVGLESVPIEVEVDIPSRGLPSFTIVGLPGKAVEESKERVRSALRNSGFLFPDGRITINLAPADLPKSGPSFDLPMALGILLASGQLVIEVKDALFLGELSLDGSVRHTNGILSAVLLAEKERFKRIFLPQINASEAAVVSGIKIYPTFSLLELFQHLSETKKIPVQKHLPFSQIASPVQAEFDMSDIVGQEVAKRAFEIAAAGGHNLLMKGPPGAGKTMLARALPGILPDLTQEEAFEVTKIYSVTGNLPPGCSVIKNRPFRAPHHTTSRIGLIGGGSQPMPGEVSLAHRGILFLDEFPEFPRHVLEALRQPMEDGIVSISRAAGRVSFPAQFIFIAASNPCPCGFFGSQEKPCTCLPGQIMHYQKKISGPIIDRIDLHLEVPAVKIEKLATDRQDKKETSKIIKKRVQKAKEKQRLRFKGTKLKSNSEMSTRDVKKFCQLSSEVQILLRQAASQMNLSARAYYKVIKIARTIADLGGESQIQVAHLAEALQYRPKEEI